MHLPDYDNSIVNLAASVARAGGAGDTGYAPLPQLPTARLEGRPVVLLVADGLGNELLQHHPDSHLAWHLAGQLTSVFPSTTAAAVTSFATAVAPQQHAITGWFTWFRELGSVSAVLPFAPRGGGTDFARLGIEPQQLVGARPFAERLVVPSRVLTPSSIVDSAYTRFTGNTSERHGHQGLSDFFEQLSGLVHSGPGYIYAYWTEVDALAHQHGFHSEQVNEHFFHFDRFFGNFLEAIAGTGAIVLVTADHGLIDTVPERIIRVEEHPQLEKTLALPLCGEPRAAFCYVRSGRAAEFEAYIQGELGHAIEMRHSRELIEAGWFGQGPADPRLDHRVGDYTLLMRDNWVIHDRLLTETPFSQIGVHGGISEAEMTVPLIIVES
ncbi:alkaline phosphatase family protein [Thiohalomonas denitrificans]|uniref:Type I phosphodiesterase / nucleotide pyrophosphatase n=1 Tax=Thiohalomonas denitrificans TaxID=415747 RepID=A0A1G5QHU1_9GAMM|nr:alkaline phosphatase family protein [Thiohalomonas denitrificans]SCZ61100.1 Type I phosphodiesterase / nucleotide pyrophosphatase [Thiohalomonas denitrificans]